MVSLTGDESTNADGAAGGSFLRWILPLCDYLAVFLFGLIAIHWQDPFSFPLDSHHSVAMMSVMTCSFALVLLLSWQRAYTVWRGVKIINELTLVVICWSVTVLFWLLFAYLVSLDSTVGQRWPYVWFGSALAALVGGRLLIRGALQLARRYGFDQKKIILVGTEAAITRIKEQLNLRRGSGYVAVAEFEFSDDGIAVDKTFEQLRLVALAGQASELWIALPFSEEHLIQKILTELRDAPVNIRLEAKLAGIRLLNFSSARVAGVPLIHLARTGIGGINAWLKNLFDIVLALMALVFLLPLFLVVACLIKLDSPGSVIYKQKRYGWNGRIIRVYKFRTMYCQPEGQKFLQAQLGDSRVTKVGRVLRKYSLDELPQLYNVLQGRMSLVGPRPHATEMNEQYMRVLNDYPLRHRVKPGITGLAQVRGHRGETDTLEKMQARVDSDLEYIENWSFGLDIRILLLTLFVGFYHRNAY